MAKPILSVSHDKRLDTVISGDLKGVLNRSGDGSNVRTIKPDAGNPIEWKYDVGWWHQGGEITSSAGTTWSGTNGKKHWQISEFGTEQGIYPSQHITGYRFEYSVSRADKNRALQLHRIGVVLTYPGNNTPIFWSGGYWSNLTSSNTWTEANYENDFTSGNGKFPLHYDKTVYDYLNSGWTLATLMVHVSTDNGTSGNEVESNIKIRNFRWCYNTIEGKNLILPALRPYDARHDNKRIG